MYIVASFLFFFTQERERDRGWGEGGGCRQREPARQLAGVDVGGLKLHDYKLHTKKITAEDFESWQICILVFEVKKLILTVEI